MALSSCVDDQSRVETVYPLEPHQLEAKLLHAGDHLGHPVGIAVVEKDLVLIDNRGERNVHVIDARSGSLRASVGNIGDGPAEFRAPWTTAKDRQGALWVIDSGLQRATRLDLGKLETQEAWAAEIISLRAGGVALAGAWTHLETLIMDGTFTDTRFAILNRSGERVGDTETISPDAGFPALAQRQAYLTHLVSDPSQTRIAAAMLWFGVVEIRAADGTLVRQADAPIRVSPTLVPRRGTLLPDSESPSAYLDLAATESHIYALFSGRDRARFGERYSFGRDVHVFDWEGRLVAVFVLDEDAFRIAVDADDAHLYTVALEPLPVVNRFDLPPTPYRPEPGRSTVSPISPRVSSEP